MDEQALRTLIRDAVTRHLGSERPAPLGASRTSGSLETLHPSHARFNLPSGDDGDGPCLIEPTVHCNHCGYCQSHGH